MEELFEQIIYQAIKKNVSDIHLQCTEKGVIKFRICGELLMKPMKKQILFN